MSGTCYNEKFYINSLQLNSRFRIRQDSGKYCVIISKLLGLRTDLLLTMLMLLSSFS